MSWMQEAVREWAFNYGYDHPDQQWLLSDLDTWERNPHYNGPDQGHPEDPPEDDFYEPSDEDLDFLSFMDWAEEEASRKYVR